MFDLEIFFCLKTGFRISGNSVIFLSIPSFAFPPLPQTPVPFCFHFFLFLFSAPSPFPARPFPSSLIFLLRLWTTNQPFYLHNLITVQPRSTRFSTLVALARPSTSSSLRITDRSLQYAFPRLWNQLWASLRQPRTNLKSDSPSPLSGTSSIGSIDSSLLSSITPSLFHSWLKTFLFLQIIPIIAFFYVFLQD